jgi:uncharacterized protein (DUF1501 family)
VTDYKALVCVYLFGGNDGNNLIVPMDSAHYNAYAAVRGGSGLALSQSASTLLQTRTATLQATPGNIVQPFAFHYGLPEIDALYAQGKVAVLLNTGSLGQPLTKAQYTGGTGVPAQLFSHADQILQVQAGTPSMPGTGWGGRLVDAVGTGGSLDAVSVDSPGLFVEGAATHGNLVPNSGDVTLAGMDFWPQSEADARKQGLLTIVTTPGANTILNAANLALKNGIDLGTTLAAARSGGTLKTVFPGTSLGNELKLAAQLIASRAKQGPGRQVYFVSLSGFDTHSGQSWQQWSVLAQVSQALAAFQAAMEETALSHQVTGFTLSDFGRTLAPSGDGSDHAWGSHHLVVGGAVKGGLYGRFPDFTLGGPDDATGRGAWIPQFGFQQMGATLGRWFGVDPATLAGQVFKADLANFPVTDLGFV